MTLTKPLTGAFCWSELGTTDQAKAGEFYTRLFHWQTVDQDMGENGVYTMLSLAGADLGGMYALAAPMFAGVPSHWLYYVSVEDVDASAKKATRLGGKVVMPPMDVPDVGRIAVLEDPEGAKIALFCGSGHAGAGTDPTAPGAFCWFELHTRDPQRAERFYTGLFGWKVKHGGAGGPMEYSEWHVAGNDQPFGGMCRMQPSFGDAPPFWLGYLTVEDTDATVKKAKALGGIELSAPMDIDGVGRFAVLADPTGAAFAVIRLQLTPEHKLGIEVHMPDVQKPPVKKKAAKKAKTKAKAAKKKAAAKKPKKAATKAKKKAAAKKSKKTATKAKKKAKKPAPKGKKKTVTKAKKKAGTKKAKAKKVLAKKAARRGRTAKKAR